MPLGTFDGTFRSPEHSLIRGPLPTLYADTHEAMSHSGLSADPTTSTSLMMFLLKDENIQISELQILFSQ